jgi:hypothetical protein
MTFVVDTYLLVSLIVLCHLWDYFKLGACFDASHKYAYVIRDVAAAESLPRHRGDYVKYTFNSASRGQRIKGTASTCVPTPLRDICREHHEKSPLRVAHLHNSERVSVIAAHLLSEKGHLTL